MIAGIPPLSKRLRLFIPCALQGPIVMAEDEIIELQGYKQVPRPLAFSLVQIIAVT
jgi:hypothetical protein